MKHLSKTETETKPKTKTETEKAKSVSIEFIRYHKDSPNKFRFEEIPNTKHAKAVGGLYLSKEIAKEYLGFEDPKKVEVTIKIVE